MNTIKNGWVYLNTIQSIKRSASMLKPVQEDFKPISLPSTVQIKAFFFINVCIKKREGVLPPHLLGKE